MRLLNLILNKYDHIRFGLVMWMNVKPCHNIADIGCGSNPQQYVKPTGMFLKYDPQLEGIYKLDWKRALFHIDYTGIGIDTIFLMDVVEHVELDESIKLLQRTTDAVKKQVIVFTPYGFMHQDDDNELNRHKSGYFPYTFKYISKNWSVWTFPHFHWCDNHGNELPKPHGAILAIYNKPIQRPQ